MMVTVVAAAIAILASSRSRLGATLPHIRLLNSDPIAVWLGVVAGALIVVGIVSQTPLRHIIQITPIVVALALLRRRPHVGLAAAAPLFAFWLLMMGAIWLFLLGVARIFTGRFTAAEIILTIVIGIAAFVGLAVSSRRGATLDAVPRLCTIAGFAFLQFAAMWLSVQPFVAQR
jgi:hypothetical protein